MFTGVLFRMAVVTELVSKVLRKTEKFRQLAIRLQSSQKCMLALVTEMYAKLVRMLRYGRTVIYFTVENVKLTQHNKRHLQVVFHASIDNHVTNT